MSDRHTHALDTLIADAMHAGLLPDGTVRPVQDVRPWPLVLMTAFGAWLAAVPLMLALGFGLESTMRQGQGAYVVAIIVLVGAVSVIRARETPLFVEQLAVPCLLVGGGLLGYALLRDLSGPSPYLLLCALSLLVGAALPRDWLRVLLGVLACGMLALAIGAGDHDRVYGRDPLVLYNASLLALAIWLGAHGLQRRVFNDGRSGRVAACIESISTGWVLAILLGLISWSGMSFMLGAVLDHGLAGEATRELSRYGGGGWYWLTLPAVSVLLALAASGWMLLHWPVLRQLPAIGVALVLIALAWCMPALGPILLILAFCLASGRTRVATAAAVAAAWVIGSVYYQLAWTLASKAALLGVAGAVLCALAWLATRGTLLHLVERQAASKQHGRGSPLGLLAGLLLVLVVVNGGIWQKEQLIARGEPVFVQLAPVDPRSLMQGDFMRLNFLQLGMLAVEASVHGASGRPHVVATRDARGVAEIDRLYDGNPLAPGEFLMELTPKNGRWVLVSDAWFFKEGEAARWEKTRYGEFRVMPDGRALLVGMRGAQLEAL